MSSLKLFAMLVIASTLCNQLTLAAESDWEVLNMALDNINAANPTVLKNSIGNILLSFLPTPEPDSTTATASVVPANPNTPQQQPNVIVVNPPATPAPSPPVIVQPAPAPSSQMTPANLQQLLLLYPQLFSRPSTQPSPQPNQPVITQILSSNSHENCDCCKKKPKSLAEFLVNVPCPTTTEKPPKKIIVKVPCPTTTTTTEKPCQCQCCPCNPCPKQEKKQKVHKPYVSEESHETVYKSYHIPRRPRPSFSNSHSCEE
ncbi:hypothetical protein PVAND_004773 [Polypedilum vanderplanki]|uniref:Uncharacterized protein n=1 Tax=Polypedilum vanderplanki TaxID=319348 RepID=A0A9J6BZ43_POLVA|nr:hypothetical protein PVAND_004773 [Polypedilum vanderplanki]